MLVLIATNELQGTVPGDYAWTVEGELVTPVATECSEGDRCGCGRGFPGLASGRATTTAMIVERPGVGDTDLRDAVADWLDRSGWSALATESDDDPDVVVDALVDEHLEMISDVCAAFPEGTVVERVGAVVSARGVPHAA